MVLDLHTCIHVPSKAHPQASHSQTDSQGPAGLSVIYFPQLLLHKYLWVSCTSIYGCLALMVREGQVLHVPAWKGLGIFSNRELDLFQVYHYLLLIVLPVVKLF